MSYENRKKEYERLLKEAEGFPEPGKYHKLPPCLRAEFGDPEAKAEEPAEEPAEEEQPAEEPTEEPEE